MEYLDSLSQKVETFVRSSPHFKNSCTTAFETVDVRGVGSVTVTQAATACHFFFKDVGRAVDDYGIRIKEPSSSEVYSILQQQGYSESDTLSRQDFETVYLAVLKYAAVRCAEGFAQKYGVGMALGFTALVLLKRTLRSVPLVGSVASPFLKLLPAPLVGPLIGILGVYVADRGDLTDVRNKLFPPKPKGQFKAG